MTGPSYKDKATHSINRLARAAGWVLYLEALLLLAAIVTWFVGNLMFNPAGPQRPPGVFSILFLMVFSVPFVVLLAWGKYKTIQFFAWCASGFEITPPDGDKRERSSDSLRADRNNQGIGPGSMCRGDE